MSIRVEIAGGNNAGLNKRQLQAIVQTVLAGEGVADAEISLAFVDDASIARVHKRFLGDPSPTDVITFPLSPPGQTPLLAELVVSAETARRSAAKHAGGLPAEIALYVVHGLLHLCGFDDHHPADRRKMRRREALYLRRLGLRPAAGR